MLGIYILPLFLDYSITLCNFKRSRIFFSCLELILQSLPYMISCVRRYIVSVWKYTLNRKWCPHRHVPSLILLQTHVLDKNINKRQELLTLREHLNSLRFLGGVRVSHLFSCLCVVLLCVFMFWAPCSTVRYDVRIKTMFDSSFPPVVWKRVHVLLGFFLFVCVWWCPTNIVLCFCFVCLRLVNPILHVSLCCPFFDCLVSVL